MMNNGSSHQMDLIRTFEDGSQEWLCPECGRHFVLHWPPNYSREILEVGDPNAVHTGGTGGVSMDAEAEMQQPRSRSSSSSNPRSGGEGSGDLDDPYLSPWANWMHNKNF